MKCISLWQPWASLIAYEHKRVETRDWGTNYRGPILIHAAKRWTAEEREATARFMAMPGGYDLHAFPPLGAVVAVARLAKCMRMTSWLVDQQSAQERSMGAWAPGRWGWWLANVRRLEPAIPLRGRQGLFDVGPTDLDPRDFAVLVTACDALTTRGATR